MEESTESHMETDVSSTTEDVPETQEVTGSNGNVEMVIVVEEMKEEETNSNAQDEKKLPPVDGNTVEAVEPSKEAPQADLETKATPVIDIDEVESPPSKPDQVQVTQKVVDKDLKPDCEIELSAEVQPSADADSSMKDSPQLESVDTPKSVQNSPKNTQNKTPEGSPKKEAPKSVIVSPTKELQVNETTEQLPPPPPPECPVEKFTINGKVQSSENSNDSSCKNIITTIPINITIEREFSNDSQLDTNSIETISSDSSERDHNKSISRELKSLINSAKESKIISECTQLTSKTRKSRSALDSSNISLNTSIEPDKLSHVRRNSNTSQKSNCSEKSEKVAVKRSMRSQNPEFVSKVKQFLNSVTGKGHKDSDDEDDEGEEKVNKEKLIKDRKDDYNASLASLPSKIRKVELGVIDKSGKLRSDPFCWRCHWAVEFSANEKAHSSMQCTVCPRSFHYKCLSVNERNRINAAKSWVCPECMIVLQAESSETRSPAMKKISLGMLCDLLKYALERMMDLNGVEPFIQPVDRTVFPDYDKYVVHPMDLSLMKHNITEGLYGSTEAFLADVQWILHNSIIFNTLQSKLTGGARALVRGCRAEMGEIEACPECYAAAHARRPTWFTDVCSTPHILLWAKLKGFPYWPAKGMSVSNAGHVDVRFFGAHDRAWVPAKDCFLYSEKDPNNFRTKRQDIIDSMQEAEEHIRNISRKYGKFVYPPFKTQFDPTKLNEQIKMMIPSFEGDVKPSIKDKSNGSPASAKETRRSNSKSSKGSNDGDVSESEDTRESEQTPIASRKIKSPADGAEISGEDEESSADKSVISMDVDVSNKASETSSKTSSTTEQSSQSTKNETSKRKRSRSALVEAVITIMGNGPENKRKKIESKSDKEKRKSDEPNRKEIDKPTPDKSKNGHLEEDDDDSVIMTDNEPSSSTRMDPEKEKNLRVTPIRIALVQKDKRHNLRTSTSKDAVAKIINPNKDKEKDNGKTTPLRQKSSRREDKIEKSTEKTPKEEKLTKSERRRNSRSNRSLTSTPKSEKPSRISSERKSDKTVETSSSKDKSKENAKENKDKVKDTNSVTNKEKEHDVEKPRKEKNNSPKPTNSETSKSAKVHAQYDDDTTLAVIARESRPVVINHNSPGLPTISNVRSLSTSAPNTGATSTMSDPITTPETIEANMESSIFAPMGGESLKNAKDTASKMQKLRNDAESMVGRVGVRAFARMTSPGRPTNQNDDVQVEIKAEPIDVDDADRQIEKLNLMNAFKLRPVNPPVSAANNLREVRINKVLVTPLNAKNTVNTKPMEERPRAKKTFPQPKKPEDRQLHSKNSMVYIPIQPPMTQAPVRPPRVMAGPACASVIKPTAPATAPPNSMVNTVTTPLMHGSSVANSPVVCTTSTSTAVGSVGPIGPGGPGGLSAVSAVHTVPLMTSVNGQWMFSFQPVMSVGAIDNSPSPPILNGVAERGNTAATIVPLVGGAPPAQSHALHQASRLPGDVTVPGEPPRLQQRPAKILTNPLDVNAPIGTLPPPSTAGPVTAKLNQNAVKLTDFFRTLLEDSLEKLDEPVTQLTTLRLQLEQTKWKHQAEIKEIKHNHDLTLAEMRALFEKEKSRAVAEARRTAQVELEATVKATKAKQWCANCSQEAHFYCCWNTSYCDYSCQRAHWPQHNTSCMQLRQDSRNKGEIPAPPERLQSHPDNLPKSSAAPTLTVGGKVAPPRVYTQDSRQDPNNPSPQKNAIIVSMVEDHSGNQTIKCVGTYKPSTPTQNMSPIIINKQIMNSEENANKKMVSSGGYLIVGGGSNNSAIVTPARRTHAIQYFT